MPHRHFTTRGWQKENSRLRYVKRKEEVPDATSRIRSISQADSKEKSFLALSTVVRTENGKKMAGTASVRHEGGKGRLGKAYGLYPRRKTHATARECETMRRRECATCAVYVLSVFLEGLVTHIPHPVGSTPRRDSPRPLFSFERVSRKTLEN